MATSDVFQALQKKLQSVHKKRMGEVVLGFKQSAELTRECQDTLQYFLDHRKLFTNDPSRQPVWEVSQRLLSNLQEFAKDKSIGGGKLLVGTPVISQLSQYSFQFGSFRLGTYACVVINIEGRAAPDDCAVIGMEQIRGYLLCKTIPF